METVSNLHHGKYREDKNSESTGRGGGWNPRRKRRINPKSDHTARNPPFLTPEIRASERARDHPPSKGGTKKKSTKEKWTNRPCAVRAEGRKEKIGSASTSTTTRQCELELEE
ncbi:hypothetical protein GUJ93_ZPchr0006g46053 [Zizania palustris]|uniref:Uncharacterized protein n=1 Tax=Zizania palustris TaxID=103762 RepID=A0A8J5W1N3_ZIZPA|nr:hypothetical protein GUJ93_ZPchr0006g46053 [Zizania palustris]